VFEQTINIDGMSNWVFVFLGGFVCLFVFEAVGEVTVSVGNVKALRLLDENFHTCVLKFHSCILLYIVQEEQYSTLLHGKSTSPVLLLTSDQTYAQLVRHTYGTYL